MNQAKLVEYLKNKGDALHRQYMGMRDQPEDSFHPFSKLSKLEALAEIDGQFKVIHEIVQGILDKKFD